MNTDLWWLKALALIGAGLWLGFGLIRVWLGWSVRRLYAGPPWPEGAGERLLPLVFYRVRVATAWTMVVVAALLLLSFLVRTEEAPMVLLITSGWWVAVVIFAGNAVWQLEHIWDDLNRAEQE
jgi:hypothetical protein